MLGLDGFLIREITTEDFGPVIAMLGGLYHEAGNLTGIGAQKQPWQESVMDMHNNLEGINAGLDGRPVDINNLMTAPPFQFNPLLLPPML